MSTTLPWLVRLYCGLSRRMLPRELWLEYGRDINEAFYDLYLEARAASTVMPRTQLFAHEIAALLQTRIDARREARRDKKHLLALRARPRTSGHRPSTPDPLAVLNHMLDNLIHDIRFALRTLRKSPMFTIVAVMTLALGIGANTAVFSVINGVLLRPLPYDEPDRLALVWTDFGEQLPQNWISGPEFMEMKEYNSSFEGIGLVLPYTIPFTGSGEPEQVPVGIVSGDFFSVMRAQPHVGRLIGPQDDTAGGAVVVPSHGFWERRFGGEPNIVGQDITLNGIPLTVIGVLEAGFDIMHPDAQFQDRTDVWVPVVPIFQADYAEQPRGNHGYRGIARLAPGVSIEQAQADMDALAARMAGEIAPDYYDFEGWGITVLSMHGDLVEEARPALVILLGAVGFVLLIACVNVANLMLTRASAREREVAVRSALGAGRRRLLQQLLTESLVLAVAGALAGLALAAWLVRLLVAAAPEGLPRVEAISIDPAVMAFNGAAALLTALLFGIAPGMFALRTDLVDSLKEGARGSTGGAGRTRMALVVGEVALALVLLVGAGLMMRSFSNMLSTEPGFRTDNTLTFQLTLPGAGPNFDAAAARARWNDLLTAVESVAGVESAGAISELPLSGAYSSGTTLVEDSDAVETDDRAPFPYIEADRRYVTPGYFDTMGYEVLRGRALTEADNEDGAPVAVVDEEFAGTFWPDRDPLGQRVAVNWTRDEEGTLVPTWREVVGVVRHARHYDVSSVGREQIYVTIDQLPPGRAHIAVRTSAEPAVLAEQVREAIWRVDPNMPIDDVATMSARASDSVSQPRFTSILLASFAGLALLLAAIGLYGVISFGVGQRVNEIGIRMALGAGAGQVRVLVLRQGMLLVAAGLVVGGIVAVAGSRVISSMLYDVSATDPLTYFGVAVLLSAVAAAACLLPATRATRVEPVSALRED